MARITLINTKKEQALLVDGRQVRLKNMTIRPGGFEADVSLANLFDADMEVGGSEFESLHEELGRLLLQVNVKVRDVYEFLLATDVIRKKHLSASFQIIPHFAAKIIELLLKHRALTVGPYGQGYSKLLRFTRFLRDQLLLCYDESTFEERLTPLTLKKLARKEEIEEGIGKFIMPNLKEVREDWEANRLAGFIEQAKDRGAKKNDVAALMKILTQKRKEQYAKQPDEVSRIRSIAKEVEQEGASDTDEHEELSEKDLLKRMSGVVTDDEETRQVKKKPNMKIRKDKTGTYIEPEDVC